MPVLSKRGKEQIDKLRQGDRALTSIFSEKDRHKDGWKCKEAAVTNAQQGYGKIYTQRMLANDLLRNISRWPQQPKEDIEWQVTSEANDQKESTAHAIRQSTKQC